MTTVVKFLGEQVTLSATPSNVNSASVVRVINTNTSAVANVTIRSSSNAVISTFTLGASYGVEYAIKQPTDTIEATGGTVYAVSVAYR